MEKMSPWTKVFLSIPLGHDRSDFSQTFTNETMGSSKLEEYVTAHPPFVSPANTGQGICNALA
jgi:hypothetical protein